jgi:hypothetical protein
VRVELEDGGFALALPRGDVGVQRGAFAPRATVFVDVTEHVEARRHLEDTSREIRAAGAARIRRAIADARGRAVGDEHVEAGGDVAPDGGEAFAAREVERPVVERGLPRASIEAHAVEQDLAVLEVVDASLGDACAGDVRFALEDPIVIARDDDLVAMR